MLDASNKFVIVVLKYYYCMILKTSGEYWYYTFR